jgi:hypothetical protein
MKTQDNKLKIKWEIESSPEAQERLLAAFEMIFKDVPIEILTDKAQFDKNPSGPIMSMTRPPLSALNP